MTSQSPPRRPFRWRPDQQWEGYLFILPSFLGVPNVFIVLAVIMSLGISFSEWGLTGFKGFAGLMNYQQLAARPRLLADLLEHRLLHRDDRAAATGAGA
jgi:ABC-type sugar transport system permease subunit